MLTGPAYFPLTLCLIRVNQSPWRSIRLHSLSTVAESLTEPRVLYRYLRAGLSGIVEDILDDFILISLTDYQQTIIALVVQWTTGWIASVSIRCLRVHVFIRYPYVDHPPPIESCTTVPRHRQPVSRHGFCITSPFSHHDRKRNKFDRRTKCSTMFQNSCVRISAPTMPAG